MIHRRAITQLAVIFAAAFGLKYHYSTASVNELRWILAPTTFLVEFISGMHFRFESHAGYLSDDRSFLIATPCSGVNFLIIAFVMLAVGKLWRDRDMGWQFLPLAMVVAYVTTLIANTTRIAVALYLRIVDTGFEYEDVHRIEGIVVYFVFLMLLFFGSEKFATRFPKEPGAMSRRLIIPLGIYYAVTLGVPFVRGGLEDQFWNHALIVIITPLVLVLPIVVADLVKAHSKQPHCN